MTSGTNATRVVAIVQARLGSVRMPRKVLEPLEGRPALQLLLERVARAHSVDEILLAIPDLARDDPLAKLAAQLDVRCFRGSESDVLDRYVQAARAADAAVVVRLTGDCPLVDSSLIDRVVALVLEGRADWACTGASVPDGLDVQVAIAAALERAAVQATKTHDREHVFPWIVRDESLRGAIFEHTRNLGGMRVSLDEPEDLTVLHALLDCRREEDINLDVLGQLWDEKPELFAANRHLVRDEGSTLGTGQKLWRHALNRIPGGSMLLSKRSELTLPGQWPAYFDRAVGCTIWDLDGKCYTDVGLMGVGTNILGYSHPKVNEAVQKVVNKGALSTLNAPEEVALADQLCELHPWAERVRFTRTGGEASAVAVRIARAASGKDVVAFCGYHGWHDWYLAANLADDAALDGHLLKGLEPAGVPRALVGTAYAFAYNDLDGLCNLLKRGDVGTIIMEVERSIPPKSGFLAGVRALADKFGAVLIFDECSSGFRQVLGGHHLVIDVSPDIAIFGKTLGNGFAINAVVGRDSVMDAAKRTFISSTFWTERIGPAAALASLAVMKDEDAPARVHEIGIQIADGWRSVAARAGVQLVVAGLPALANFSIVGRDPGTVRAYLALSLLGQGYLGTNALYASIAHDDVVLSPYLEELGKILRDIGNKSDEDLRSLLPNGPSWMGFSRLT